MRYYPNNEHSPGAVALKARSSVEVVKEDFVAMTCGLDLA
jgi:hypothetical protein